MKKEVWASLIAYLSVSLSAHAAINDSAIKVDWGYKGNIGPERWAKLNPAFALCATGTRQSPVNLTGDMTPSNAALSFQYRAAPMAIMDNGVTQLQLAQDQIFINDGHGIQLNFHPAAQEYLRYDGEKYQLVQLHFHSPSENEREGRRFPLEIHFVHQGSDGKVIVVGVFVRAGGQNPIIQKVIEHLPKEEGKESTVMSERVNPADLLPTEKAVYAFDGSLTTPPCTEGLRWLQLKESITATPAQIQQLRWAAGGDNARPIQSLNGRRVYFKKNN
jgi:carbonic anhydrase